MPFCKEVNFEKNFHNAIATINENVKVLKVYEVFRILVTPF